ncbi:acetylornithine aminotransferase [Oceanospirillum multiglobuliferum]|uniref:Acetylornithine aminotransferase n=1 Tax=Oceanospirillum multiglobuliferum TaxID=64969 RepID=A0A1T4MNW8_9GAMM|nr:aspartate aminotransferase family protein [Oceanospirillum multiglobuliferum]OPX56945.1 aspartate aminotransferase family protein [Oceanospirillum multiglobuliferum]SJZ68712.1 acetylornithine aminotransferase [Oceanospirillum multiglobuliferum]
MTGQHLMNTYGRLPVAFTHGKGAWLYDEAGKQYLDAVSGVAVCGLGHAHPAVTQAICEQAARVMHTSNLYRIPAQETLGERLCQISGMDRVFFSNSGAEANEAAIKLARLHGKHKGIELPTVIVMENAFHGRTIATLTATGNRKVQAGFEPLVQGFARARFNDIQAVESILRNNKNIVAVMVEPVQGEGGLASLDDQYLPLLRALCDKHDLLMILDEIQTGNGRTGTYFAYQQSGIKPDVVTTAKGLGNGFPIGACLAQGKAAALFQPGSHGSTYGGNPLGCFVAEAVVKTLVEEKLPENAAKMGQYLRNGFAEALANCDQVVDIRGKGLMLGIELKTECSAIVAQALEAQILINVTAGNVIRLLPPLTINKSEADQIIERVSALIFAYSASSQ